MKRILILVDNSRRDLLPSLLLKSLFEDKNCVVGLCNKRDYKIKVRLFRPDAFLASRGDMAFLSEIAKVCKVYVIPAEGARLTPETMKSVFLGRIHNGKQYDMSGQVIEGFDFISKVYLWGNMTKEFLLSTEMFKEEQLDVVGNGRLDVYKDKKIIDKNLINHDFTLGVAISIKSLSSFQGNVNYLKVIHSLFDLTKSAKFPMVPEGRHYEDYVWRDFAIARKMMEIILNIMANTNYKMKFRIGPFENIDDYKFLQDLFPGRIIIQDPSEQLIDFLSQIDLMITCWSTTGLESVVMDIPVVAIPFLIDKDHLLEHVAPEPNGFNTFLKLYHTPESVDEVMELIEARRKNELPIVADQEFFESFIKNVYNWPMEKSTTRTIVEDILNDMKDNPIVDKKPYSYLRFSNKVEKVLKSIPLNDSLKIKMLVFVNDMKFLVQDVKSRKYISSKMHHELSNEEVSNLVERAKKFI